MSSSTFSLEKWVPEDFFAWMDFFYKLKGFYPPENMVGKIVYLFVSLPNICACTFLLICLEWMGFLVLEQDFKSKMKNISSATLNTIVVFRTAMWFLTRRRMDELKNVIRRKSFRFECFGISEIRSRSCKQQTPGAMTYEQLTVFWRHAEVACCKERNELQYFTDRISLYTRLGCCSIHISITVICITTYLMAFIYEVSTDSHTYEAFNPHLNKTSMYRTYQYPMYFPFDVSLDGYYWLGLTYNYYARIGSILLFLPIETLLTSSIIHLISQVIIVQEAFKFIDKDISYDSSPENALNIEKFRLVKCINELQQIYRAIEILEDVCNKQLLVQYSCATFILCSICYVLPLVDSWIEAFVYMIFMMASLGEVFIFSYCCQTLTLKLQEVAISVYNLNWPCYNIKLKISLCFLLRRLQKPANLTAGKIVNIDLFFFIKVIQKSYSFYTLISNTKSKK